MAKLGPIFVGICAMAFGGGCFAGDGEPDGTLEPGPQLELPGLDENSWQNGASINGGGENGLDPNGIGDNGHGEDGTGVNRAGIYHTAIVGAGVHGTSADGDDLGGILLEGSAITSVRTHDGARISGDDLVGATFSTSTVEGLPLVVRLDAVEVAPTQTASGEVFLYTISYRSGQASAWYGACGKRHGAPIKAIPLAGRWNYAQGVPGGGSKIDDPAMITFACEGFALAKCVRFGYEPWVTVDGASLSDHHQACIRMIRADYCGDGRPWTVNGMMINLYDDLGIQADTESWQVEAEWSPDGARCLSHQRLPSIGSPGCAFELASATCGEPASWGPGETLLVSEVP